jgi:hypothetical protein
VLGFDAAVDYKASSLFKTLRSAVPQGIDVYLDNVGGDILEACLAGRIACCGAISQYGGAPQEKGPRGMPGFTVVKRLTLQGFVVRLVRQQFVIWMKIAAFGYRDGGRSKESTFFLIAARIYLCDRFLEQTTFAIAFRIRSCSELE